MTTPKLLEMVRQRRAELQAQGPRMTDEEIAETLLRLMAKAPHDSWAAEMLRKCCTISPEIERGIKAGIAAMEEEAKARGKTSRAKPELDDVQRGIIAKHGRPAPHV